jgi:hypothetical protein
MAAQPIERVRSEHLLATPRAIDLRAHGPFVSPDAALRESNAPAKRLSLEWIAGRAVYLIEPQQGRPLLLDAASGERLSPIGEGLARTIAEETIAGDAASVRAVLIERNPPIEYRGDLPVWRVDFAGDERLSVYVSADSGRAAARRSDLWRVYDFLWSLHIMDYRERENFNHPLLVIFSIGALMMSAVGIVLLAIRLPPRLRRTQNGKAG